MSKSSSSMKFWYFLFISVEPSLLPSLVVCTHYIKYSDLLNPECAEWVWSQKINQCRWNKNPLGSPTSQPPQVISLEFSDFLSASEHGNYIQIGDVSQTLPVTSNWNLPLAVTSSLPNIHFTASNSFLSFLILKHISILINNSPFSRSQFRHKLDRKMNKI